MHTYTHAHTLEGTLMWTHVVHTCTHYTCEQCRQKKQQTQASSETIQMHVPVQIKQHLKVYQGGQLTKPRMNMVNYTKQNKTNIFLHKRPCPCPQTGGSPPTWGTRHTTIPQLQGLCAGRDLEIKQRAQV